MPITPADLKTWIVKPEELDLTRLEGGARLKARFVSFLALRHPELLQAYLKTNRVGPYEAELLMLGALSEVTRSRLRGKLAGDQLFELLDEWAHHDEDAYELLNQLRPQG